MTRIDSFVSEDVSNVESDYEGELDSDKVTLECYSTVTCKVFMSPVSPIFHIVSTVNS